MCVKYSSNTFEDFDKNVPTCCTEELGAMPQVTRLAMLYQILCYNESHYNAASPVN